MLRSWKLGTAFGIGVYVHWSFLLLPAWVLLSNLAPGGLGLALYLVALVLAVFGCVVLHELGHALTARRFGIRTRDITLYPIGGVARLERMSERPWEEFWIAVAGPAVNVVIAGLLWCFLDFSGWLAEFVALPVLGLTFLAHVMLLNLFLAGFNLLPAFPMDGGRVLRALLSLRLGRLRATQVAAGIGQTLALVMGLAGLGLFGPGLSNPSLLFVALFVYFAGQQELAAVYQQTVFRWHRPHPFPEEEVAPRPSPAGPRSATVYLWDERNGTWVPQKPLRQVGGYGVEAN